MNYDLRHDLSKTLSSAQKAEITRYYAAVDKAVSSKHIKYAPRNPANLAKAKKATGQVLPKLRAVAINSPTGAGRPVFRERTETTIKVDKLGRRRKKTRTYTEIAIEKEGGFVRTIYLDQRALARNPREYLESLMVKGKRYIIAGNNDWRAGGDIGKTIAALEEAMLRYGWGGEDEDEDFKKVRRAKRLRREGRAEFNISLVEVDLSTQKSFLQYKAERRKAQDDYHTDKRKERKRAKRGKSGRAAKGK